MDRPGLRLLIMLIVPGIIAVSCTQRTEQGAAGLIETDRAFSRMSEEKGLNEAFIRYAADSVIKMREGMFPLQGRDTMAAVYRARPDTGMVLRWQPVRAEVAASGDLGYTFGDWELTIRSKDTTLYGNYISVWKRQSDGSWKYVLDAGCNTPKPANRTVEK